MASRKAMDCGRRQEINGTRIGDIDSLITYFIFSELGVMHVLIIIRV
jgi:hypothetical protein